MIMNQKITITNSRTAQTLLIFNLNLRIKNVVAKGEIHDSVTKEIWLSKWIDIDKHSGIMLGNKLFKFNSNYKWINKGHIYNVYVFNYTEYQETDKNFTKIKNNFEHLIENLVSQLKKDKV